ncbi:MAG: apolipoprotein N-acyltransferase, partial [Cyanobacteriota bacterium]
PLMVQRQFRALAQLRAIEAGRWLVSAANTGPSLLVSPQGVVTAQLPSGGAHTGLMAVPQIKGLTIYGRLGEWPLLVGTGTAAVAAVLAKRPPR